MKLQKIIIGSLMVVIGLALFAYYDQVVKPRNESRVLFREAEFSLERGDKDSVNKSINMFAKVVSRYPHSAAAPEAYYKIARAYEKIGLYRLAYLKYSYVLKNYDKRISSKFRKEVLARLASINLRRNHLEEGEFQLYSLLNNSSGDSEFRSRIYSEIGHSKLKAGDHKKARKAFEIALNEYGENQEAILGKARILKKLGKDREAYNVYDYFLKYHGAMSPYTEDVLGAYKNQAYQSGLASYRRGSYYQAIGFFNRLLRVFPGDKIVENCHYWLGETYSSLKKHSLALKYFNRVLSNGYHHKDEDAMLKKGYIYFSQKQFEKAAKTFNRYIHHYPGGKYISSAKKWKGISDKEIYYKYNPDVDKDIPLKEEEQAGEAMLFHKDNSEENPSNEEVVYQHDYKKEKIKLENITEI